MNKLKIREVCDEYALDILFEDMSVNTIYFNSKRNAEAVKRIILDDANHTLCVTRDANRTRVICLDGSCPHCKEDILSTYNYCPYCGAKMDLESNEK